MKQSFKIFICVSLFLIAACGKQKPKVASKPDWVINESTMVDMVVDLRIVDAATYNNKSGAPRNKTKDWEFVMKKYKTNDSIFRKSQDYYCQYPKVLESIYEQAIDKLSEMQANNYSNTKNTNTIDTAEIVK